MKKRVRMPFLDSVAWCRRSAMPVRRARLVASLATAACVTVGLAGILAPAASSAPRGAAARDAAPDAAGIDAVRRAVRAQLDQGLLPVTTEHERDRLAALVLQFYRMRRHAPAWVDGSGINARGAETMDLIAEAEDEGLSPARYRLHDLSGRVAALASAGAGSRSRRAQSLAETDILLTTRLLALAMDHAAGRVGPAALALEGRAARHTADWGMVLHEAARSGPRRAVRRLAPPHAGYERLRSALRRYRSIDEAGGWGRVPAGPRLARGAQGERVLALRRRLAASGDLESGRSGPARFDRELEDAVRRFQERHGLAPTGTVGAAEIAALNVPARSRIRQIQLNMERWRWLPASLGRRHVAVNVPDFSLRAVESGRSALTMRVVVGKDVKRTPIFSDTITHLVFNPYWTVPASIVSTEIRARVARNPNYLVDHRIRVYAGGGENAREVSLGRVGYDAVFSPRSRYWIRQEPGAQNPLGRVKFVFPNRHDIYMHDTPYDELFDRRERDFSHGCIRVERPAALAAYVLRGDRGWPPDRIGEAMKKKKNLWVRVPRPVPIHILYWTAWADERGLVQFRDDVYGIDADLEQALRRYAPEEERREPPGRESALAPGPPAEAFIR